MADCSQPLVGPSVKSENRMTGADWAWAAGERKIRKMDKERIKAYLMIYYWFFW